LLGLESSEAYAAEPQLHTPNRRQDEPPPPCPKGDGDEPSQDDQYAVGDDHAEVVQHGVSGLWAGIAISLQADCIVTQLLSNFVRI